MQAYLIQNSIASGRLQLNTQQKVTHYFPVLIGLIFPAVGLFLYVESYFKNETIPYRMQNPWIWIISFMLFMLIYWLQHKRLRLKTIETSLSREDSLMIVRAAIKKLNWGTKTNNKEVIIAKVFNGWLAGSWGEQVTIIFDGNKMYINSICDPDKKSSLTSYGNNKKNIAILLSEIKKIAREGLLLTKS
jgi:hypothetical protein